MANISKLVNCDGRGYYVVMNTAKAESGIYHIKVNKTDTKLQKVNGKWAAKGFPDAVCRSISRLIKP